MEQHHDAQIECADCGAAFVFSAGEAAVFVERGLTAPKRCKDCRRARKDRAQGEGHNSQRRPGGFSPAAPPAAPWAAGPRGERNGNVAPSWTGRDGRGPAPRQGGGPRYTGDVNEYRSPMQAGAPAAFHGQAQAPRAPSFDRGRPSTAWRGSGEYRSEYRSPMPDGFARQGRDGGPRAPRAGGGFGGGAPRAPFNGSAHPQNGHAPHSAHAPQNGHAEERAPRRRPPAEMFSITCDACGAGAEVPFKPAEGREVYCPTCYRARRPVL
jgi:CxxC-x17-CxxC domain-containing protein